MPAGRFVLTAGSLVPGAEMTLPDDIARQARDVLRMGAGDTLRLLDGAGGECEATLTRVDRKQVVARLGPREEGPPNPPVRLMLCLGLLKAAKFEWVLQKGTELGAAGFQPLLTERAVAATDEFGAMKRRRYERIMAEALEQCGGSWLPSLGEPLPLAEALARAASAVTERGGLALIPWERESEVGLRDALQVALAEAKGDAPEVWLFIGPEGGFSQGEVERAEAAGAQPVTLGPRILRAETAAIVAATLALDAAGALEGSADGLGESAR